MKRGIPNGKGKYILSKMTVHEGDYVNGQLNGKGQITIKYKNDSVFYLYNGQLSDDVPNGFGEEIYFYSDGDTLSVYKGNFSKGDKQGPGLLKEFTYYVTTIYKGYFDLNKPQGKVEIWDHYKGKPVNYYKGDFYNGERDGYGEEVFGFNKYCGEWKKNNKNGIGKLFFDSLLIYDGDWRSGKFNGSGKRYFLDGSYYFGEFKNNQRDGIGVLSWTNGTKYIGEFEKDLFMGSGYIIKDDHVDVSGDWRNGLLATKENVMAVRNRLEEKHKGKLQQFEIKDSIKDNTLLPPR